MDSEASVSEERTMQEKIPFRDAAAADNDDDVVVVLALVVDVHDDD